MAHVHAYAMVGLGVRAGPAMGAVDYGWSARRRADRARASR
ncbi:hypothetical protein [Embleya scabrispora]|nr:hypothetical protein [Embleya scabrispora]